MTRAALAASALLALPAAAAAQPLTPLTTASGVGGFGGGTRPNTPALVAPNTGTRFVPGGGIRGGFCGPNRCAPGFPFSGVWVPPYGFGYSYPYPVPVFIPVEVPVPVAVTPPEPVVPLSNEFPAVLSLEFPAPAEVWVNGQKAAGGPATEWTLTSPVLKPGGRYTFDVTARWTAGGKTFEYVRAVTVAGGDRSRALVVSGTLVGP